MKHLNSAVNPNGGAGSRREFTQPALNDHLMERRENMGTVWKRVKANGGASGVDGVGIKDFPALIRSNWSQIRQTLLDGGYQPSAVKRVMIPKRSGGEGPLGILTVQDRVIQQSIQQVLTPIFDPIFSESSFGFRPGRSAHGAIRQVQRYIAEGHEIVVDLDLEKFRPSSPNGYLPLFF